MLRHSVFEDHSSCAFFQERWVVTEKTVNFEPLFTRLTLLRFCTDEADDRY